MKDRGIAFYSPGDFRLQRKAGTRLKHSLKMEWLIPESALPEACCEQPVKEGRGAPAFCLSSWRNIQNTVE